MTFWSFLIFFINSWYGNTYCVVLLYLYLRKSIKVDVIFCFALLLLGNCSFLSFFKYNNFYRIFIKNEIVSKLIDGLIELHPMLFYIATCGLVLTIQFLFNFVATPLRFVYRVRWYFLIVMLTALASGGFWSFSQSEWGRWWTWDPVEFVLLIIFFFWILVTHTGLLTSRRFFFLFLYGFFVCVSGVVIIRLGLLTSRHTFLNIAEIDFKDSEYAIHLVFFLDNFIVLVWPAVFLYFFFNASQLYKFICFFLSLCLVYYEHPDFPEWFENSSKIPENFVIILIIYSWVNLNFFIFFFSVLCNFIRNKIFKNSVAVSAHALTTFFFLCFFVFENVLYTSFTNKITTTAFNFVISSFYKIIGTINSFFFLFFFYLNETATLHIKEVESAPPLYLLLHPAHAVVNNKAFVNWYLASQIVVSNFVDPAYAFTTWWAGLLVPFIEFEEHRNSLIGHDLEEFVEILSNGFIYNFFNKIILQNDPMSGGSPAYFFNFETPVNRPFFQSNNPKLLVTSFVNRNCAPFLPHITNYKIPGGAATANFNHKNLIYSFLFSHPDPDSNIVDFFDFENYQKSVTPTKAVSALNRTQKINCEVDALFLYNSPCQSYAISAFILFFFLFLMLFFFLKIL